jgi:hypothetical protein
MRKKVLIIEEHEHFRKLLSMYLSKKFQVLPASNGLEAMGWVRKGIVPNVIISGAESHCRSTEDFFSTLNCSGIFAHIPIINLLLENASKSIDLTDLEHRIQHLAGSVPVTVTTDPATIQEGVFAVSI